MSMRTAVLTAAAVALLAPAVSGRNDTAEQITVPLSAPGQPGTLIVNHGRGSVSVSGYDGPAVIVMASPAGPAGGGAEHDARGLTWLAAGETRLSATENGNTVTATTNSAARTIDLRVLVPRRFNLKLGVKDNGRIDVDGVEGEMEITNSNGDVRLDRVSGSAVVHTVDGDVVCLFDRVAPGLPLAFSSVYGKIDVSFPADADLTVRMKTDQGSIFSDFDIAVEPRKSLSEPAEKAGGRRVSLEDWTTGRIGRGGTDVRLQSFEGNIYIRKSRAGRP